ARRILLYRDEARRSAAFDKHLAHAMTRGFGRDHADVHSRRTLDGPEANVKAVGEHQRLARLQVGLDIAVIDLRLLGVGREDHDGVGPRRRIAHREHLQPGSLGAFPRTAARLQPDTDINTTVTQVQRVRMALRSVADYGDLRGLHQ